MNRVKKKDILEWKDIYELWGYAISELPELHIQQPHLSVGFSEPKYGQVCYFNWARKGDEEKTVQSDLVTLSRWQEIGENWSKGTIRTASILARCETDEERAAVWIAACMLSLTRSGIAINTTIRNAHQIEHQARIYFTHKYGYWHTNSREFFPEFYIPNGLLWDGKELTAPTLIELAALNASMVLTHYTMIEYKMSR